MEIYVSFIRISTQISAKCTCVSKNIIYLFKLKRNSNSFPEAHKECTNSTRGSIKIPPFIYLNIFIQSINMYLHTNNYTIGIVYDSLKFAGKTRGKKHWVP